MRLKRLFVFLGTVAVLAGCKDSNDDAPNVDGIEVEVRIESLSDSLFACRSEAEVRQFLEKASVPFARLLFGRRSYEFAAKRFGGGTVTLS